MSSVLMQARDNVLIVTINRPEVRNAVDGRTAHELADAFRKFDAEHCDIHMLGCGRNVLRRGGSKGHRRRPGKPDVGRG